MTYQNKLVYLLHKTKTKPQIMTLLNLSKQEMENKAAFYLNELSYLLPTIESEKTQAHEFVSKLTNLIENMEMANVRQSFIDACISCVQGSLKKFA